MFVLYISFNIKNVTIVLGGGRGIGGPRRYSLAKWGEVQRHRVLISFLFGKFVSFIKTENIIVCSNFLDCDA